MTKWTDNRYQYIWNDNKWDIVRC